MSRPHPRPGDSQPAVTCQTAGRRADETELGDQVDVTVGTFNLNNLFSRFNFQAQVDDIVEDDPDSGLTATYTFNDPERFRLRTYQGRLVHGKNPADQDTIAARIAAMDLDVLCAQEVEDIDTCGSSSPSTWRAGTGSWCWWRATTRG